MVGTEGRNERAYLLHPRYTDALSVPYSNIQRCDTLPINYIGTIGYLQANLTMFFLDVYTGICTTAGTCQYSRLALASVYRLLLWHCPNASYMEIYDRQVA